jgi:hypothetical protein
MNDHCPVFGRGTKPGLWSAPVFSFASRLKNAHLLRCVTPAYEKYASFLMTSRVLHPGIFESSVGLSFRRRPESSFLSSRPQGKILEGHALSWPHVIVERKRVPPETLIARNDNLTTAFKKDSTRLLKTTLLQAVQKYPDARRAKS